MIHVKFMSVYLRSVGEYLSQFLINGGFFMVINYTIHAGALISVYLWTLALFSPTLYYLFIYPTAMIKKNVDKAEIQYKLNLE